ncbi:hypothetical protein M1N61_02890 [Peptococcaceae bacterium]|nr:hypothetical protein [Peptococcaceae bacterium]
MEKVMMNQEIKTKGEMMLEKSEKISSFWAFKEEPLSNQNRRGMGDRLKFLGIQRRTFIKG